MSRSPFPALRTEGGLLPLDLFTRIIDDPSLPGREPAAYGLGARRTVREAASRAFEDITKEWQALQRDRSQTRDWLRALYGGDGLGFGPLEPVPGGLEVDGKTFKVSHRWQHVPVHWLPWSTDLDRRTRGVVGAADAAPQSMVQDLLNRTDDHLYAMISNGQKLRLLRDSRMLAGSAYVEFDLELISSEGLFPDFLLLYRLLHASRFELRSSDSPASCWLETWRSTAIEQGERALQRMRGSVRQAINILGTGLARHPANRALRERLADGSLDLTDYKRSVLRLVYRLLFWFVADDRDVLLDPDAPAVTRERYDAYFSSRRLRGRARIGGADHHEDLWAAVRLVFTGLGSEGGLPELGIPGIGGIFERITLDDAGRPVVPSLPDELDEPLENMQLTNDALLSAVRSLAIVDSSGRRRQVDFLNLDSEELGSVYESLLELHPSYDPAQQIFTLIAAAGNERKTTGSYYTPSSLTEALLDSALDPVLDDAVAGVSTVDDQVKALLNVTVCDPACGSGHFLVAAARRIARRVAKLLSSEEEPSPSLVRAAMRQVVSRCVYGVDINETAAELAKVSLWLESVEPGKPLPFLDANIRVGNSLLGTTPALIRHGIPQEAFKALVGDDPAAARAIAKRNAEQTDGKFDLFAAEGPITTNTEIASQTRDLVRSTPRTLADVYVQRRRLRDIDGERLAAKRVADAWCAAFVQPKTQDTALHAITGSTLDWIVSDPDTLERAQTAELVEGLARDYRFFHWHVEFPHIFTVPADGSTVDKATGWRGGFSCVIGNPPWERVKLQEKSFFASRHSEIASARKDLRTLLIADLAHDVAHQALLAEFEQEKGKRDREAHFFRSSDRYQLTTGRNLNTYALFAELGIKIIAKAGRCGVIVKTGIVTDLANEPFFHEVVQSERLASVTDFENRRPIFPDVHRSERFCLLVVYGQGARNTTALFGFMLTSVGQLQESERIYQLTSNELRLINPNTFTCPVFQSRRDARVTIDIYRHGEHLDSSDPQAPNSWKVLLNRMFHSSDDSSSFESFQDTILESRLPLYEAKMVTSFDHRAADVVVSDRAKFRPGQPRPLTTLEHSDPNRSARPRFLIAPDKVAEKIPPTWNKQWLPAWRDVTSATNERTLLPCILPICGTIDTLLMCYPQRNDDRASSLISNLSTFVVDFVTRQKIGGAHVKYHHLRQLPIVPADRYGDDCDWQRGTKLGAWVGGRVLELTYTSYDMAGFARDHGDEGAPFRWDEERRFWLRAELDAAYFHLYGVPHDDVDYIMDTFRAFKKNDPERFACTKTAILDIFGDMAKAIATGEPYRTRLNPPPGHGPRHPAKPDSGVTSHA